MDDRIRAHAETLVDWSARVQPGDRVVMAVGPDAHPLAVATAEELGARRASFVTTYAAGEVERAYLQAHGDGFQTDPEHERSLYEEADVYLSLGGGRNIAEGEDIPDETRASARRATKGIREARLETRWVKTLHPTHALAQQAGMSLAAYRDFAYGAICRDWESLAEEMAELVAILDAGDSVRIESDRTDLTLDIGGRTAVNSAASVAYDSHNLPSGEVFTAPASVTGTIVFDVPMTIRGQPVRDLECTFDDGELVNVAGTEGADLIEEIAATDEGASRVGEFGVGMNRGIDRPTNTILFDEKMAGTVHLALGRAYDACVPTGQQGNDSAVHVDLIADLSEESRMSVDGEIIQRDGRFRWEDHD